MKATIEAVKTKSAYIDANFNFLLAVYVHVFQLCTISMGVRSFIIRSMIMMMMQI